MLLFVSLSMKDITVGEKEIREMTNMSKNIHKRH